VKFIYVDESGGRDQGDIFTMCGLMVDAYKLRKKTEDFDARLEAIFALHSRVRNDQQREKIGRCPETPGVKFFNQARHEGWKL